MNSFLKVSLAVLPLASVIPSCQVAEKEAKSKPNILFIISDDQSFQTLNQENLQHIHMPNINRLISKGVRFSHTYNMGGWNGAICVASRAMLNTGMYLWNAERYETRQEELSSQGNMWSQLMSNAGYTTYMSGKWHVKTDPEIIFDHVKHKRPGMPPDFWENDYYVNLYDRLKDTDVSEYLGLLPVGYNRPQSPNDTTWQPWDKSMGGFWNGGKHWTEVLADDALDFLKEAKKDKNPFFMYLAFNAPHDPRQSPRSYVEMYPVEEVSLPPAYSEEYPYMNINGCDPSLRDEALAPFPRTEYAVKKHRQEYYAIISHMDHHLGRILDALEESGEAENTWIIFTSDHGLSVGNHGLIGKQSMYDHSIRVPFVVSGPGIKQGEVIDRDIYLQDAMPTCLELAGAEIPEFVQFHSLMPFIQDSREQSYYPSVYGSYINLQRMVRKDGYKLILYPSGPVMRLYDLRKDPYELNDISGLESNREILKEMFASMLELQAEMNDTLDLTGYYSEYTWLRQQ